VTVRDPHPVSLVMHSACAQSVGSSPLLLASLHGHEDVVTTLIAKGADVNLANVRGAGNIAFALARPPATPSPGHPLTVVLGAEVTCLALPCGLLAGWLRCAPFLPGSCTIGQVDHATPLTRAGHFGRDGVVCTLLMHGAAVNALEVCPLSPVTTV
jgi:hypothetical protein